MFSNNLKMKSILSLNSGRPQGVTKTDNHGRDSVGSNNTSLNDGKPTYKQEVNATRTNYPDKVAPYGEFTDNDLSWGKANVCGIIMEEFRSIIVSDGIYDASRFERTFSKYKDDTISKEFYETEEQILGKFNYGCTDGCILLGNKAKMIHNFGNGNILMTELDINKCMCEDKFTENSSEVSEKEKTEFMDFMKLICDYKEVCPFGTCLIIDHLNEKNTDLIFDKIHKFMYGLYDKTCHNKMTIHLFNYKNPTVKPEPIIIEPEDLSFGCIPFIDQEIHVYIDNKNNKIYSDKLMHNKTLLYKFKLIGYLFDSIHLKQEQEIFKNKKGDERVGFNIRRGGRLLTGFTPPLWDLSTGMNRAKGLRIMINIPANNEHADNDWGVTTFKKINEDNWKYFNPKLTEFITDTFSDLVRHEEKDRKNKQENYKIIWDEKNKNFDYNISIDEAKKEKLQVEQELDSILRDKDDKRIMKKNGKAYNAINAYITKLDGIINKEKIEAEKKKKEKQVKLDCFVSDVKPDTKQSNTKPDTKQPDTKQSNTKPDTKQPDTKQSDVKPDTKQSDVKPDTKKTDTKQSDVKPDTKKTDTEQSVTKLENINQVYEKTGLNHLEEMKKINDIDEFKEKILI